MIKIKQLHSECEQTCRAVVFETGWTTVRNWCPRTSVHQAGTRVKTWCLPPLLHKIFFCAREIVVAHSWAKLYVAITGETTLGLSTKRKTQSFFCVAFEESASLAFYIPAFFFFFFISSVKKIRTTGLRKQRWKFSNCSFVFFLLFFFSFDVWNMNCIGMDGRYEWIIDIRFYYLKVINEKIVCSYCSCYLWNYTIVFLWFQSFAMNFNIFILITICYKNFILCQ